MTECMGVYTWLVQDYIMTECMGVYTWLVQDYHNRVQWWDIPCSPVKPHPSFQENSHEQNLGKGQTSKEWKAQAQ